MWFLLALIAASGFSAKQIMENVEGLLRGRTSAGVYEMEVVRPDFGRTVRFKFWDDRTSDRSLILILSPRKDRGTAFLKVGTDLWMYIPKVRRTVRIPPSMMLNSWMGSDFTHDDVSRESSISRDYVPRLLKQREDTVLVELRPKPEAGVVWDRVEFTVLLPNIPLKAIYFDEEGHPVRAVSFSQVRRMGGRRIPTVMEAVPLDRPGHRSILRLKEVKFDVPLDPKLFTLEQLERITRRELR